MTNVKTGIKLAAASAAIVLGLGVTSAQAGVIDWVDWTSASSGSASGTLAGGSVAVGYSGGYSFAQTAGGPYYWTEDTPAPYTASATVDNAPGSSDIIALNTAGTRTITFSKAVTNPLFAFVSWNGTNSQSIDFGTAINILSVGDGFWGSGGSVASAFGGNGFVTTGGEPHGVVQLPGTFTSFSFTDSLNENWHGFTVGIEGVADGRIPEPATLGIMGLGLAGIGLFGRRRKVV